MYGILEQHCQRVWLTDCLPLCFTCTAGAIRLRQPTHRITQITKLVSMCHTHSRFRTGVRQLIRFFGLLLILATLSANQELARAAAPGLLRLGPIAGGNLDSYVFKAGDYLILTVYREADLSIKAKIDQDGSVVLPLIGELKVGGLTLRKARLAIAALYEKDYLVNPHVTLDYDAFEKEFRCTVLGRVNKQGGVVFPKGVTKIALVDAIALAGGFERLANRSQVSIKRNDASGVKVYKVDAKKLAADPSTPPFYILPGDTITVPERIF